MEIWLHPCDFSAIDKNNLEEEKGCEKKVAGGNQRRKMYSGLALFESISSEGYCVKGLVPAWSFWRLGVTNNVS